MDAWCGWGHNSTGEFHESRLNFGIGLYSPSLIPVFAGQWLPCHSAHAPTVRSFSITVPHNLQILFGPLLRGEFSVDFAVDRAALHIE